jgi:hypothetical protein
MQGLGMAGRKRKFRGTSLRPPNDRRPDDRILSSLQPHRKWLPEAMRLSEKAVNMLGCLNLKGLISDEQHEAGRLFSVALGAYRSVIGGPGGTAGNGRGYDCRPIGCDPKSCECLHRTANYLAARFALADAGTDAMQAVESLIIDDRVSHIANVKCGLTALQFHFGLTAGRKSHTRRNTN